MKLVRQIVPSARERGGRLSDGDDAVGYIRLDAPTSGGKTVGVNACSQHVN